MTETLGALMNSKNSLKLLQDESCRASILGTPIITSGRDRIQINVNIYVLIPEKCKELSSTFYNGKSIKNKNDILMMDNIISDLGYTGIGDRKWNRKTFFTITLPNLAEENKNNFLMKLQTTLMIYKVR